MSAADSRLLARSAGVFFPGVAAAADRMQALEGAESGGEMTIKPLVVAADMLLLEIFEAKGVRVPEHAHDDHESVVYLVKGSMKVVIGGEAFVARPGDAWLHPPGVRHWSEALEDCVAIEVKSPPRKTWQAA